MTCSKCEYLVRVKNKLGYNLYYCGYKKYGVLKALSGLYINNEEYRKNSKTCKYYKGVKQMTNTIEEFKFFTKEDMNKAQERIEVLEKENEQLKAQVEKMKCCENCKHSYTDSENLVFCYLPISQEECKSCRIYNHKETENDYWEQAK